MARNRNEQTDILTQAETLLERMNDGGRRPGGAVLDADRLDDAIRSMFPVEPRADGAKTLTGVSGYRLSTLDRATASRDNETVEDLAGSLANRIEGYDPEIATFGGKKRKEKIRAGLRIVDGQEPLPVALERKILSDPRWLTFQAVGPRDPITRERVALDLFATLVLEHADDEKMRDDVAAFLSWYRLQGNKPESLGVLERLRAENLGKKTFGEVLSETRATDLIPFVSSKRTLDEAVELKAALDRLQTGTADRATVEYLRDWLRQQERGTTFAGGVAEILRDLPAFAGEIAATGGVAAAGRKATKTAVRKALKAAIEREAESRIGKAAVRAGAAVAGEALRAPLMAHRVVETAMRTALPQVKVQQDAGDIRMVVESEVPTDFWEKLPQGYVDTLIETLTERMGPLVKMIPGTQLLAGTKAAIASRWLHKTDRPLSELAQRVLRVAEWHGVIGEVFEERAGEVLRGAAHAITGGAFGVPYRPPTARQLAQEIIAFAIPGSTIRLADEMLDPVRAQREAKRRAAIEVLVRRAGEAADALSPSAPHAVRDTTMTPDGDRSRANPRESFALHPDAVVEDAFRQPGSFRQQRPGPEFVPEVNFTFPSDDITVDMATGMVRGFDIDRDAIEQAVADIRGRIRVNIPQADMRSPDGTPLFRDYNKAYLLAQFRNQRRLPGEPEIRVAEIGDTGIYFLTSGEKIRYRDSEGAIQEAYRAGGPEVGLESDRGRVVEVVHGLEGGRDAILESGERVPVEELRFNETRGLREVRDADALPDEPPGGKTGVVRADRMEPRGGTRAMLRDMVGSPLQPGVPPETPVLERPPRAERRRAAEAIEQTSRQGDAGGPRADAVGSVSKDQEDETRSEGIGQGGQAGLDRGEEGESAEGPVEQEGGTAGSVAVEGASLVDDIEGSRRTYSEAFGVPFHPLPRALHPDRHIGGLEGMENYSKSRPATGVRRAVANAVSESSSLIADRLDEDGSSEQTKRRVVDEVLPIVSYAHVLARYGGLSENEHRTNTSLVASIRRSGVSGKAVSDYLKRLDAPEDMFDVLVYGRAYADGFLAWLRRTTLDDSTIDEVMRRVEQVREVLEITTEARRVLNDRFGGGESRTEAGTPEPSSGTGRKEAAGEAEEVRVGSEALRSRASVEGVHGEGSAGEVQSGAGEADREEVAPEPEAVKAAAEKIEESGRSVIDTTGGAASLSGTQRGRETSREEETLVQIVQQAKQWLDRDLDLRISDEAPGTPFDLIANPLQYDFVIQGTRRPKPEGSEGEAEWVWSVWLSNHVYMQPPGGKGIGDSMFFASRADAIEAVREAGGEYYRVEADIIAESPRGLGEIADLNDVRKKAKEDGEEAWAYARPNGTVAPMPMIDARLRAMYPEYDHSFGPSVNPLSDAPWAMRQPEIARSVAIYAHIPGEGIVRYMDLYQYLMLTLPNSTMSAHEVEEILSENGVPSPYMEEVGQQEEDALLKVEEEARRRQEEVEKRRAKARLMSASEIADMIRKVHKSGKDSPGTRMLESIEADIKAGLTENDRYWIVPNADPKEVVAHMAKQWPVLSQPKPKKSMVKSNAPLDRPRKRGEYVKHLTWLHGYGSKPKSPETSRFLYVSENGGALTTNGVFAGYYATVPGGEVGPGLYRIVKGGKGGKIVEYSLDDLDDTDKRLVGIVSDMFALSEKNALRLGSMRLGDIKRLARHAYGLYRDTDQPILSLMLNPDGTLGLRVSVRDEAGLGVPEADIGVSPDATWITQTNTENLMAMVRFLSFSGMRDTDDFEFGIVASRGGILYIQGHGDDTSDFIGIANPFMYQPDETKGEESKPGVNEPIIGTDEALRRGGNVLDALEKWGERRIMLAETYFGRMRSRLKAGIDPMEIAMLSQWLAGHIIRGTVRSLKAAKALIEKHHGDRYAKHIRRVWRDARKIAENAYRAFREPPLLRDIVEERFQPENRVKRGSGPRPPKPGRTIETKAVAAGAMRGMAEVRATIPGILAEVRRGMREDARTQRKVVRGLKRELVRLVKENLTGSFAAKFLGDVARVETLGQLAGAINKIRREAVRQERVLIARRLKRLRRYGRKLLSQHGVWTELDGNELSQRAFFDEMMTRADRLLETLGRSGRERPKEYTATQMERDLERLREVYRDIAEVVAAARMHRKLVLENQRVGRAKIVKQVVAEVRRSRPSVKDRDPLERQDVRAGVGRRLLRFRDDIEVIAARLSGRWDRKSTMATLLYDTLVRHHEDYFSEVRDRLDMAEMRARQAGYKDLDDARDKTSRAFGEVNTRKHDVVLGGERVRLTTGNLMKIYAMLQDRDTVARLRRGRPIKIEGGRSRRPLEPTLRELKDAADRLSYKEKAFVDDLRAIRESMRPKLFEAFRVIKGYEPEVVPGYEPRSVERSIRDEKFTIDDIVAPRSVRWLENMGFMKERTGGGEAILIGDFLTDWTESIKNSAKMIHLAGPIKTIWLILSDPEVREAISERHGVQVYKDIQAYLVSASLANERITSKGGKAAARLNQYAAVAFLGANVASWLRQLGGVSRLAAVMPKDAFAYGVRHWHEMDMTELELRSGYFWDRYQRSAAARFSLIGEQTRQNRVIMRSLDRAMQAGKQGKIVEMIRALQETAAGSLVVLNWFDSIAARVAMVGYLREADRVLGDRSDGEKHNWAVHQAQMAIRRTQNSSSVLDMPIGAIIGRDSPAAFALLFSSDAAKQVNRIRMAYHSGDKRAFALHAGVEMFNILWSRGVGMASYILLTAAGIALAGGDEDDYEALVERATDVGNNAAMLARDILGVTVDPVITPRILDSITRPGATTLDVPFLSMLSGVEQGIQEAATAVRERDPEAVFFGLESLFREATAISGLNPLAAPWRSVSRGVRRGADAPYTINLRVRPGRGRRERSHRRQRRVLNR